MLALEVFYGDFKMAVPKKKTSKSKRDMRRSHDRLADIQLRKCSYCGKMHLPHNVCDSCGFYGKKLIYSVKKG
jgi:large subunit ribosomal protein L32